MIDIGIVGGGVAGLWILNRLRSLGYDAHLFERTALGTGQTIACQGIIHSGAKYTLAGKEEPVDNPLRGMPVRWKACFEGKGELDLRAVKILGEQMAFVKGEPVYLDGEPVIDVKSLLLALSRPVREFIYLGTPPPARLTIWTAGIGNEAATSQTQRRPLRMFMVRPNPFGNPVFVHWTGKEGKPGMTITTHGDVLYLGGNVAEEGHKFSPRDSLFYAMCEAQYRFPNIRWGDLQWAYHDVIRAEGASDGALPDGPRAIFGGPSEIIAWPTKLAMAPLLADRIVSLVNMKNGLRPSFRGSALKLPKPTLARYPWETARWS